MMAEEMREAARLLTAFIMGAAVAAVLMQSLRGQGERGKVENLGTCPRSNRRAK
jgi:hypothetical protein